MASALGDEHPPTTAVVTKERESAPLNSVAVPALVPAVPRPTGFASNPGPETLLTVRYHVALMTVTAANYHSFSTLLRTRIVQECLPRLVP